MFVSTVSLFNKAGELVGYTTVDSEDFTRVINAGPWRLRKDGYVHRKIGGKTVLLHRFILGTVDSSVHVDHWDHDPLNNRRSNLRPGTQTDNNHNPTPDPRSDSSSVYKGVGKYRGGWRAQGWKNGKTVWLGKFATEEEAAAAYDEWRKHAGIDSYTRDSRVRQVNLGEGLGGRGRGEPSACEP